jgi:hypothetical protein
MTKIQTPTPEEHAYHLGWTAYFNEKYDGVLMENPFLHDDNEENNILYDKWNAGWLTAQVVATSMEDA